MKTVAIIGAGAIGSYFIWGMSKKLGENLWIIADGERKERLQKDGLMINGERYDLHVKTPEEASGVDLLLICTKYGAIPSILDSVETIVTENTVVMSLLNGVDSEEIIGARIGMEHIIHSFIKIASQRVGNSIVFDGPSTLGVFMGEKGKSEPSERMLEIGRVFDETDVHYRFCEDIIQQMWFKFALNVSQNQPQAMIGCGFGAYTDSVYANTMREKLRAEVVAVAKAKGIDISTPDKIAGNSTPTMKRARYSTLQDLDAKRHTEVDVFAGAMVRMGKELGIPTPFNEFTYYVIKALEEKNDGKFDYE